MCRVTALSLGRDKFSLAQSGTEPGKRCLLRGVEAGIRLHSNLGEAAGMPSSARGIRNETTTLAAPPCPRRKRPQLIMNGRSPSSLCKVDSAIEVEGTSIQKSWRVRGSATNEPVTARRCPTMQVFLKLPSQVHTWPRHGLDSNVQMKPEQH